MEANELIAAVGERLGIELKLDEDDACSFGVDDMVVTINYISELNALVLIGDLGEPPPERLEALYKAMLEANHLFAGTAGSTLSRDPENGRISLCRAFPCRGLDADILYKQMERYVSTLEIWMKLVSNFREAPQESDAGMNVASDIPEIGFRV